MSTQSHEPDAPRDRYRIIEVGSNGPFLRFIRQNVVSQIGQLPARDSGHDCPVGYLAVVVGATMGFARNGAANTVLVQRPATGSPLARGEQYFLGYLRRPAQR